MKTMKLGMKLFLQLICFANLLIFTSAILQKDWFVALVNGFCALYVGIYLYQKWKEEVEASPLVHFDDHLDDFYDDEIDDYDLEPTEADYAHAVAGYEGQDGDAEADVCDCPSHAAEVKS